MCARPTAQRARVLTSGVHSPEASATAWAPPPHRGQQAPACLQQLLHKAGHKESAALHSTAAPKPSPSAGPVIMHPRHHVRKLMQQIRAPAHLRTQRGAGSPWCWAAGGPATRRTWPPAGRSSRGSASARRWRRQRRSAASARSSIKATGVQPASGIAVCSSLAIRTERRRDIKV